MWGLKCRLKCGHHILIPPAGFSSPQMASAGLRWSQLASDRLRWPRLASARFRRPRLASPGGMISGAVGRSYPGLPALREGGPRESRGGLLGTCREAFREVRESPGELSQGPPGRGGGELSGGVPGSSPWDLGGGGLGAPGESQGELKMESKWSLKWRLKVGSPRTLKMWISIRS